jgi:hypothetical protein
MKALVIYLAIVVISYFFARFHKKKIDATTEGNYNGGFPDMFIRFMVIMALSFAYIIWNHNGSVPYPFGWLELVVTWFRFGAAFWMFFDIWLNLLRGKKLDYISTTNGKLFDSIFKGNFYIQLTVKILIQCVYLVT